MSGKYFHGTEVKKKKRSLFPKACFPLGHACIKSQTAILLLLLAVFSCMLAQDSLNVFYSKAKHVAFLRYFVNTSFC